MSSATRDRILRTLRLRGKCTVNDLAEASGVSPVSVRHHLANLQAEKLVEAEEVKHGVGRPRLVFALSDTALEMFPSRYFRLTNRILEEIKDSMPADAVRHLFASVASTMAADYAGQLEGLPLEERLERLIKLLSDEGFEAELEGHGDRVTIRELSCPYYRMGREHPEVCVIDQTFIATSLSLPVERVSCLLDGDSHCSFSIPVVVAEMGEMDA
jgi:DeoR family suf operon transcriptional repressor